MLARVTGALFLVCALLSFACSRPNSNQHGDGIVFSVPSGQAHVGDVLVAAYTGTVDGFWNVTDDAGNSAGCDVPEGAKISCLLQSAGTLHFKYGPASADFLVLADDSGFNPNIGFVMTVKDSTGHVVATVSSDVSKNSGTVLLRQGDTYTYSFDSLPTAGVSLSYAIAGGGVSSSGSSFTRTCQSVGAIDMMASAEDSLNDSAEAAFTEFCQCRDTADTLAVNPTKVSVTAADPGAPNLFNFSAAAAVSGGSPPYLYNWSPESKSVYTGWTSTDPSPLYRAYSDSAAGGLRVLDACNFLHEVAFVNSFNISTSPGLFLVEGWLAALNTQATADPYVNNRAFIVLQQANLSPGASNVRYHYHYDASGNGTLNISGLNFSGAIPHGFTLSVSGLVNPTAGSGMIPETSAHATSVTYTRDGSGDGLAPETYQNTADCPVTLAESLTVGQGTCGSVRTWSFDGTFSCPELTAPDGAKMSVENGRVYGQVVDEDSCP